MRYKIKGTVADWTFYEVTDHGFSGELANQPLYGFTVGEAETPQGQPKIGELFANLEHAMAAAIAEKFTGKRGAGGTGVGTAADWFMKMIGVGQLRPAEAEGTTALSAALVGNGATANRWTVQRIETALGERGIVLARSPV
jgi:hypothetical protein